MNKFATLQNPLEIHRSYNNIVKHAFNQVGTK